MVEKAKRGTRDKLLPHRLGAFDWSFQLVKPKSRWSRTARDSPRKVLWRVQTRRTFNDSTTMAVTKGEETGESSTAAAKKLLKPNANGIANYELPW